jgi:cytochrome c551
MFVIFVQSNKHIGDNSNIEVLADNDIDSDKAEEDVIVKAEKWYQQSCSLCHGSELEGKLGNPALIDIKDNYTLDKVYKIIIDGTGDMPGGFLQGAEARSVAEWIIKNN